MFFLCVLSLETCLWTTQCSSAFGPFPLCWQAHRCWHRDTSNLLRNKALWSLCKNHSFRVRILLAQPWTHFEPLCCGFAIISDLIDGFTHQADQQRGCVNPTGSWTEIEDGLNAWPKKFWEWIMFFYSKLSHLFATVFHCLHLTTTWSRLHDKEQHLLVACLRSEMKEGTRDDVLLQKCPDRGKVWSIWIYLCKEGKCNSRKSVSQQSGGDTRNCRRSKGSAD